MRHSYLPLSLVLAAALAACQQTTPPPASTPAPNSPTAAAAPTEPSIPEQQGQTTTYLYQCGELAVTASFHGDDAADLSFNGRALKLPRVVSASGARYADADGNEFWSKGDVEAVLTLAGEAQRSCTGPGANPA